MAMLPFCHPFHVSLAVRGEFQSVDDLGELIKLGSIRLEILNQSGLIRGALRVEFGAAFETTYEFWATPPIEHPKNESTCSLLKATVASSVGVQELRIRFTSSTKYELRGTTSGVLASDQTYTSDLTVSGITILGADWDGVPNEGDLYYILCYTIDPMIAGLCAKLTALELLCELMYRQNMENDLKLLRESQKRWFAVLAQLRDGKFSVAGRTSVDIGRHLSLPRWDVDETGMDLSRYQRTGEPGDGLCL